MIEIRFHMSDDLAPNFEAVLNIGQWTGLTVPTGDPGAGRFHMQIEAFEPTRLSVTDSACNPIVVATEEDPGPTFLELTVSNRAVGQLNVEVPGSDILRLAPNQTATVSYQRTAARILE